MDARDRRMNSRVEQALGDLPPIEPLDAQDPPPETATRTPTRAQIPGLLTPLSHVLTEDARDELARVAPARWRLRVHMYDPEAFELAKAEGNAPTKDENDELHGYVCVEKARPVAHCQPDVLAWLQQRDIVGDVVLEWLGPIEKGGGKSMRHFVHIPGSQQQTRKQEPAAPVMRPAGNAAAAGQQDFYERMFDRMQQESAELRDLIKHITDSSERQLEKVTESTRHTINDLRDSWNEQIANDPRRKIGELVEKRVTDRVVEELGGPKKDVYEELATQLQKIESTKTRLAPFFADPDKREQVHPLEEKLSNAIGDILPLWLRHKAGLPVSGESAMNLVKQLGDLNKEGEALLGNLEKGAA